ncbi:hypothetical protein GCM10025865_05660 [Paraoerskovia sediminicola]|uniref:Uncharacterized protein n=1 Tax=Paraoerskovia sediminicola TaxID=1138587 RepID=A0ABN6XCA8_9CELL|nr:hypothetical protein GCM10025865_05660 [Paraoerskovia sediminicola]
MPRAATAALPLVDPEISERISSRLELVEARLRETVTQADTLADTASRHLVSAGGSVCARS